MKGSLTLRDYPDDVSPSRLRKVRAARPILEGEPDRPLRTRDRAA